MEYEWVLSILKNILLISVLFLQFLQKPTNKPNHSSINQPNEQNEAAPPTSAPPQPLLYGRSHGHSRWVSYSLMGGLNWDFDKELISWITEVRWLLEQRRTYLLLGVTVAAHGPQVLQSSPQEDDEEAPKESDHGRGEESPPHPLAVAVTGHIWRERDDHIHLGYVDVGVRV